MKTFILLILLWAVPGMAGDTPKAYVDRVLLQQSVNEHEARIAELEKKLEDCKCSPLQVVDGVWFLPNPIDDATERAGQGQ